MKDIVVDNSVTHRFENPAENNYRDFMQWLETTGVIALSENLIKEILATTCQSRNNSAYPILISKLQKEGRISFKSPSDLASISITPARKRELLSNHKDHAHLKLVLCTVRKLCLTEDRNLCHDINLYKQRGASAHSHPSFLSYV